MMADMMYGTAGAGGDVATDDHANDFYGATGGPGGTVIPSAGVGGFAQPVGGLVGAGMYNNSGQPPRPRFPGLYVGNLTWWTTDRDVIDAINSIGVNDVQEVKFFENRNNGQSKGFCVVTFGSDVSLPIVMEKLPLKELHGQNPVVASYNRQNLSLFESQNKMIRPQMNSTNGPNPHAAGIMGINSISGVHAAAAVANPQLATAVANLPYATVATAGAGAVGLGYNQAAMGINTLGGGGAGGPRGPYHSNMRMQMRGPRPMMGGSMNNGPMMSGGHQMNRMRFMPRQSWNNSQGMGGGGYNQAANRIGPQMNMDISSRLGGLGGGANKDDLGSDMQGSSSYYNSHHSNSQSDHYSRSDNRDHRDHHHRELRDDRDSRRLDDRPSRLDDRPSRLDDRPSRLDDRSSRLDERSSRLDERSSRHDDRLSSRDHDRASRLDDRSERSRRSPDHRSSGRRLEDERGSSRRGGVTGSDDRRDRDDRSSRREEKPSSSTSRHHREKSHRSDDRVRSRSRSKERSSRAEASKSDRRDRDRDVRKERY